MTLQQTLQANTGKVKELFDQLQDTSDQAVKKRENLFEELARELRLHADVEQRDVIPALRKSDDTKDLATEAAKTNRELRAKIDEIEALPKGDAEFLPRLGELRKLFDQQVREERRELVPALRQNLSADQVAAVEEKIDARRAKADEEERARAEERREEARRERDRAEAVAAGKRAAKDVADATKRNARELRKSAGEAVQKGVHTVEETSGKIAESVTSAAKRLRDDAGESVTAYRETARERGRDVKAVASALRSLAGVRSELRSVMVDSIKRSGRDSIETAKRLFREPKKFGEVQRDYLAAATRNAMESTQQMLLIVRRVSNDARQPVEARLRVAS